jgi:hypothetical protein
MCALQPNRRKKGEGARVCGTQYRNVQNYNKYMVSFRTGLWIRIGSGFSGFLDPDSESGSSGKKQRKFVGSGSVFGSGLSKNAKSIQIPNPAVKQFMSWRKPIKTFFEYFI